MTLLLSALIYWFSPRGFEPAKAPQAVVVHHPAVVGLCAALHAVILLGYTTQKMPVAQGIMGVMFLFFILLGNVMGRFSVTSGWVSDTVDAGK